MEKDYNFLGGITPEVFLRDYWQKKPLLVRNAFPEIENLISPDELAGLTLEPASEAPDSENVDDEFEFDDDLEFEDDYEFQEVQVESRLIRSLQDKKGQSQWLLDHGPFTEEQLKTLPDKDWTLLVQAMDIYNDDVATLLDVFSFIPRWRIDDVMISLAAPGGSVGPHYDNYDVFLIQGMGHRQWKIGEKCNAQSRLLKHPGLKILAEMECLQEWELSPGDMLYLPPLIAHHGIALDNCMTFSVGFRAPSMEDLFGKMAQQIAEENDIFARYNDTDLKLQNHSGWLSDKAVEKVQTLMMERIQDSKQVTDWLAKLVTEPKYSFDNPKEDIETPGDDEIEAITAETFYQLLKQNPLVLRDEYSRFAYTGQENQAEKFYINGLEIPLPEKNTQQAKELVIFLCDQRYYESVELLKFMEKDFICDWFITLYQKGYFYFQETSEE